MSEALHELRAMLAESLPLADRPFAESTEAVRVFALLERTARQGIASVASLDVQLVAVNMFWQAMKLASVREGRLVCFGICLPIKAGGPRLLDDGPRFSVLLNEIDQWIDDPRRFRRCYQGLLINYFSHDPSKDHDDRATQWVVLRQYLADRVNRIADSRHRPDWVTVAIEHAQLFGDAPCERYGIRLLEGDTLEVDRVRQSLGITDASWFTRDVVFSQITAAINDSDKAFVGHLEQLLTVLKAKPVLHDRGLAALLDRYARIPQTPVRADLRDHAVKSWGNPWLKQNTMRWGTVGPPARAMVTGWLKLEFIETFFTLLAEEGSGDRRRLEYWKKHVGQIEAIHFALGADARNSRLPDFVELRKKMAGITVDLADTASANNAFVMTIGTLVVVEFSGTGNALYGYDAREDLPFDLTRPVVNAVDRRNSLKMSQCLFKLRHVDSMYESWETKFDEELRRHLGGGVPARQAFVGPRRLAPSRELFAHPRPASGGLIDASVDFVRYTLRPFAESKGLKVEDHRGRGGNLWVFASSWDAETDRTLSDWGFSFKPQRGWWRGA
jgi:hypothetical protein